jgi:hypothetical protein
MKEIVPIQTRGNPQAYAQRRREVVAQNGTGSNGSTDCAK